MTSVTPQVLNDYVMQAMNIREEDIEANRKGTISLRQDALYGMTAKQNQQAMQRYLLLLPVMLGGVVVSAVAKGSNPLADLVADFHPFMLVPAGVLAVWLLALIVFAVRGGSPSIKRKRVHVVAGPAKLALAGEPSRELQSMSRRLGVEVPCGRLTIGGKTFQTSEDVLRAFQPGANYRAYYVKIGSVPQLIAAEALDPASAAAN